MDEDVRRTPPLRIAPAAFALDRLQPLLRVRPALARWTAVCQRRGYDSRLAAVGQALTSLRIRATKLCAHARVSSPLSPAILPGAAGAVLHGHRCLIRFGPRLCRDLP